MTSTNDSSFGDLHDYATGEYIREATAAELIASLSAGPEGAFALDGRTVYVQGGDETFGITDEQIQALALEADAAGDVTMAAVANSALRGNANHRACCAKVIADAAAQREYRIEVRGRDGWDAGMVGEPNRFAGEAEAEEAIAALQRDDAHEGESREYRVVPA